MLSPIKQAVMQLAMQGKLRVKETPEGLKIAAKKGSPVKAHVLLAENGRWTAFGGLTVDGKVERVEVGKGFGIFALCRFLGLNITDVPV